MIDDQSYFELTSYLQDELTPDEVARVEQELKQNGEASSLLLLLAEDEARIAEWARSEADATPAFQSESRWRIKPLSAGLATLVALAASLLLVVGLQLQWWSPMDSADGGGVVAGSKVDPIASVAYASTDCQWFIENRIWESDEHVYPQETLHLNKGNLDLTFVNHTKISLSAPAVLEIEGPMLARLQRGSVNVEVGEGAEGFEVLTPLTRVVDLGTRFGLNVDDEGLTDVVVFEGAVVVEAGYDDQASETLMQRLDAGEGVRFDHQGTMSRVANVAKDRFPARPGESQDAVALARPIIISEVWDNIERGDSYKFYEIIPAGMREDARAFVDRVYYEWNGVDPTGMPSYLLGSDYVKTFNSDKLKPSIVISLRLEQPANVYLLIDNRATIPDWVRNNFEDTGDDIGIDEGHDKRSKHLTTDVGPGKSINSVCSVWKRTVYEPGVLELGALGEEEPEVDPWCSSMYGIAAAPLDE